MNRLTGSIALAAALAGSSVSAQTTPTPSAVPAAPVFTPTPFVQPAKPSVFQQSLFFARPINPVFANSKRYVDSYQQVQSYGRCVADIGPAIARRILDASPNTVDERESLRRLYGVGRACLPYGYAAPVIFIRGGLAEALYRRTPVAAALHTGGTTATQVAAFQAAEMERSGARLADDRVFTALANCLAVRAPEPVAALLHSRHGSPEERTALDLIIGGAPGCTGARRFPTNGERTFLRAYLAESAYRWAAFAGVGAVPAHG